MTDLAGAPSTMAVCEGWILAGVLDGNIAYPRLLDEVCGIPHVLRLACDLATAGATRVVVVWNSDGPPPDLAGVAADVRLASRATLAVVTEPPPGDPGDRILVARADRLFHRDMPKLALAARGSAQLGRIAGAAHDAVFATDRAIASRLADRAATPDGIAGILGELAIGEAPVPYAGFTARATGPRSLRLAERELVWSLRKSADGIAAKAINRHISLRLSLRLAPTRVHPNHVTLAALVLALAGGAVIATGSYAAAVIGMLLVELGSIVDGVDGELARLRYQFSRVGQWLDTTVDDVANVAYISGTIASLAHAGVDWAVPLGCAALGAFAITQSTQYALISIVYKSGDLAAIPWAFQSTESLSRTSLRATLPKLLKRDFVVTVFTVLAICGRLDAVLVAWSAGALAFFVVFFVQLVRNRNELTTS